MSEAAEREVSPGIFVTDFRTAASIAAAQPAASHPAEHKQQPPTSTSHSLSSSNEHKQAAPSQYSDLSDVNQLSFDLHALHNSIDHLIASNAEMVTAMEEEAAEGKPDDEEYASAIRDNMLLIDRKQNEAAELQAMLDAVLGGHALDKVNGGAVVLDENDADVPSSLLPSSTRPSGRRDEGGGDDGMYL